MHGTGQREQIFRDRNRPLQPGYAGLLGGAADDAERVRTQDVRLRART